ncbi:hypothetical protein HPB50_027747 [Hyalomma asiaticum]|nr:hypothetical protein HPB50_027747 [Hyalomma asiaticum]
MADMVQRNLKVIKGEWEVWKQKWLATPPEEHSTEALKQCHTNLFPNISTPARDTCHTSCRRSCS